MAQIVPAILENTFEEIQSKVKRIKPYTNFIQLDIMDGTFVPNETFRDTKKIATLDIEMEVHLMIDKPALFCRDWFLPNVKRLIVHYETLGNAEHDLALIRKEREVGVALNPETSTYEVKPYLDNIDMVVIMGVDPGWSGQEFHKDVLEKIKEIKQWKPEMVVEVDGGVNDHTARMIIEAGADMLGANSALWTADDLGARLKQLAQ